MTHINGYWDDFIGVQWTPEEFKEWNAERNAELPPMDQRSLLCEVSNIVDGTLNGRDIWWTDMDYVHSLMKAYEGVDRNTIIDGIMEELA
jgi:hypothetical protein